MVPYGGVSVVVQDYGRRDSSGTRVRVGGFAELRDRSSAELRQGRGSERWEWSNADLGYGGGGNVGRKCGFDRLGDGRRHGRGSCGRTPHYSRRVLPLLDGILD